jgi:hypothetical protein
MDVSVDVIAPVIVAALVNGNDTVGVIDTVDSKHPGMEAVDRKRSGDESVRELIDAEFYARGIEMLERDWRS